MKGADWPAMIVRETSNPSPPVFNSRFHEGAVLIGCSLLFLTGVAGILHLNQSKSHAMEMPNALPTSMVWTRHPGQTWFASASAFLLMWMLMTMFMMSPSLFQALRSIREVRGIVEVALGYFFVWLLLGSGVFVLGVGVTEVLTWSRLPAASIPALSAVSILCAGLIQLSPWKRRRLMRCRELPGVVSPLFPSPFWKHGLWLGLDCVLCCSGFTLAMVAWGLMDLRVMAIVGATVTAERFASRPHIATRISGMFLVSAGVFLLARTLVVG